MKTGTVKFFNESKGFGFITLDDGSGDVFVHVNNLAGGPIQERDKVKFEVQQGRKGPEAVNVSLS